ncbi:MAG: thiamine-monophosphate kinase [Candidatus Omnitrophica bacterium]|nr:thiamine-monophosphate kinase [Candidatus Omnitrophota bacterium]
MIKSFDELAWIDYLKSKVKTDKSVLTGIGDDCAVVSIGKEKFLLKSDMFIEGVHFELKKTTFLNIGKRAVARVLSDFAACAGLPIYIGASVAGPCRQDCKYLKEILAGMLFMAKKYKFSFIGGDTARAKKFFIDIWGMAKTEKPVLRSGAKTGDLIFITGRLGKRDFHRSFEPRIKEARFLTRNFKINSMIDISDGLIIDLYRLAKASRKGALVLLDKVPVTKSPADLYRGEDYELIFTVDKREKRLQKLKELFYPIGEITAKNRGYKAKTYKSLSKIKVKGYRHF